MWGLSPGPAGHTRRGREKSHGSRRTRAAVALATATLLGVGLAGCGGPDGGPARDGAGDRTAGPHHGPGTPGPSTDARQIPDLGPRLRQRVPARSTQVVVVHGGDAASASSTVTLYLRRDGGWHRAESWPAHNGRRGWTREHHEGDKKSPSGVFTLSDAGGVLPDPGAKLPYTSSPAFTPPATWAPRTHHDFDHVIAIDYNRMPGTSPLDPTRPLGQGRGGGIWLHLDHGSGTSGCVSVSRAAMRELLRTLDPAQHPVVVMGDREFLAE